MTTNEIKKETKKFTDLILTKIHSYGFYFLLIICMGIGIGVYGCNKYQKGKVADSIKLKGFIYNNEVYEINKRIVQ